MLSKTVNYYFHIWNKIGKKTLRCFTIQCLLYSSFLFKSLLVWIKTAVSRHNSLGNSKTLYWHQIWVNRTRLLCWTQLEGDSFQCHNDYNRSWLFLNTGCHLPYCLFLYTWSNYQFRNCDLYTRLIVWIFLDNFLVITFIFFILHYQFPDLFEIYSGIIKTVEML